MDPATRRRSLSGGAIAGLCGGLGMTLMALALGVRLEAPLAGLLIVAALAAGWGALFGFLFAGYSPAATVGGGLLWGFVVWLLMFKLFLPLIGRAPSLAIDRAVALHLVYGVVLGLSYLPFQKPSGRSVGPVEEPL